MNYKAVFKDLKADGAISKALKERALSHAYLFVAEDSQFARLFCLHTAKKILGKCDDCGKCENCVLVDSLSHPDLFLIPKPNKEKILVEDADEIIEKAYFKPTVADSKVFVLSGMENMNESAQNKILKILEEPPKNTYFIMHCKNADDCLATIRSRTVIIYLPKFSPEEIYKYVYNLSEDKKLLKAISESSDGKLSKAVAEVTLGEESLKAENALKVICNLKSSKDILKTILTIGNADLAETLTYMQNVYRDLLLVKTGKSDLVTLKSNLETLAALAEEYSVAALIESTDKISQAFVRAKSYENRNVNLDELLLSLLEVKFNCR